MNILVIGNNDVFSRWVTVALSAAGNRVSVMSPGGQRLTPLSRHCRTHIPCGPQVLRRPDLSIVRRIEDGCRRTRADWIVPSDLPATLLAARHLRDLTAARVFPVSRPELVEQFNDKWEFHRLLRSLELPSPETRLLESLPEAGRATLPFPVMIKPLRQEGGVGVRRVEDRASLLAILEAHGARHGWPLLAQEFLPGSDIDLSVLADRGRIVAWTIQRRTPKPEGSLEFLHHARVLEIGTRLIRATGYHGVVHFDMRIDERRGEPFMIEANPRFWGSLRHSVWMGVNFPALGIAMAQGEDVGSRFSPVAGRCWDPGFSVRSIVQALLRGKARPEAWSSATESGWRCHLGDPAPFVWERLRSLGRRRARQAPP